MIELPIKTQKHTEFILITQLLQRTVEEEKWKEGILTVFIPHTTAAVTIQENADPDVVRDMIYAFEKIVPWQDPQYRHAEGNTAAHVKASMIGTSTQIIIHDYKLQLGTWQGIYFCEFDGPRNRNFWIKFS
jgi:secondary thiamine-phosphate synthase enzyme